MRLIDADKFKENILSGLYVFCQENKEDIARAIDDEPTVTPDKIQAIMSDYLIYRCEPKRPQGEWLANKIAFHFVCDQCGCALRKSKNKVFEGDYDYNFCPNCGAEMEVEP